jgi:Mce-associated membrane protein
VVGSESVLDQSPPARGLKAPPSRKPPKPEPEADARPGRRAAVLALNPGWMFAGLSLLLAAVILATSILVWKAAADGRTQAGSRMAASSAASASIEKLLGYDYRTFDRHTTEVSALLTGGFKNEFVQAATKVVKPLAVQNQAVVQAAVSKAAVMSTPGIPDTAGVKVLLFVDQRTTSAKLKRPQVDQNRVILTMSQVGGRWLVSKVEAF